MVLRLFWDSNSNVLKQAHTYIQDWDSSYATVQETIRAIGDVLNNNEQDPNSIHEIGLDISIQTIETRLTRMQEIQEEATRVLNKYDHNTIGGLSVKNAQSITSTTVEALAALVGVVSQFSANIREQYMPSDRTTNIALGWVAFAGYGSALILSGVKEGLLRVWRANEEKAGKLRTLTNQRDLIPSIQSICRILKIFKRVITPHEPVKEHEWLGILHQIKQIPKSFQENLRPIGMRATCLNTPNFQHLERRIRTQAKLRRQRSFEATDATPIADQAPPKSTTTISPARKRLLRKADKIRAQHAEMLAEPQQAGHPQDRDPTHSDPSITLPHGRVGKYLRISEREELP